MSRDVEWADRRRFPASPLTIAVVAPSTRRRRGTASATVSAPVVKDVKFIDKAAAVSVIQIPLADRTFPVSWASKVLLANVGTPIILAPFFQARPSAEF